MPDLSGLPAWDLRQAAALEALLMFILLVLALNEWIGDRPNDKKKPPRTGRR